MRIPGALRSLRALQLQPTQLLLRQSATIKAAPLARRPFSTTRRLRSSSNNNSNSNSNSNGNGDGKGKGTGNGEPTIVHKMIESAATSFASILVIAVGFATAAYAYHKLYKIMQLQKMANAFEPGDPVLDLAAMGKGIYTRNVGGSGTGTGTGTGWRNPSAAGGDGDYDGDEDHWVQRPEQAKVDKIVAGNEKGHYHLLMGEKGTGKSSMLIEAMRKIDGEGVAMFEAHSDLEIFRIRLGKALDYEFHEDYIGGYFSERGPRDTTALLDIERALNKLEKVALRRRAKVGRPLVVIMNQMHLVRDDEDGRDLIELLQQRAEQWAASNLVTMVFNSDDYWVYERLKLLATRMEVLSVSDLPKLSATAALKRYRKKYFKETLTDSMATQVYDSVGGRLSFLNRVAKSNDMLKTCDEIKEVEKTYFLNQCWILGEEMDDDVMDQQKWAVSFSLFPLGASLERGSPSKPFASSYILFFFNPIFRPAPWYLPWPWLTSKRPWPPATPNTKSTMMLWDIASRRSQCTLHSKYRRAQTLCANWTA